MVILLMMVVIFGYFGFHYDSDPISCKVSDLSDYKYSFSRLKDAAKGKKQEVEYTVDVGQRFRLCFWLVSILCAVEMGLLCLTFLASFVYKPATYFFLALANLVEYPMISALLFLFFSR